MTWNFRKKITIIPGVHLNISKSGVSTSIGIKGASITIGKNGTYLNNSIPGTGIYNRHKLNLNRDEEQKISDNYENYCLSEDIFSAENSEIESQNMQGVKTSIELAINQKKVLQKDIELLIIEIKKAKFKLKLSYFLLFGFIFTSFSRKIKLDIDNQFKILNELEIAKTNSFVNLIIEFNDDLQNIFSDVINSFKLVKSSNKIWDITKSFFQDSRNTRSSASTLVIKKEVKFRFKNFSHLKSAFEVPFLENSNGSQIYIYPNFIIMYKSDFDFALVDINDIEFSCSPISFTEDGYLPNDSKILSKTWAYVNQNGTPDKRFNNNYEIPVVRYCELKISSKSGINEVFQISNYENAIEFGRIFNKYKKQLKSENTSNIEVNNKLHQPENTLPLIVSPEIIEESVNKRIFETEASIIIKNGTLKGEITKLAGIIDSKGVFLYLGLEDWKKFDSTILPNIQIILSVQKDVNLLTVKSSNKDISPLKKGDRINFLFDNGLQIEKTFEVGRVLNGKSVINLFALSDIELISLSENIIDKIIITSALSMPYEFYNKKTSQYDNIKEGKELFQIMSSRIVEIKTIILKQ